MTTISEAFTNALLADASYVSGFLNGETGSNLENRLSTRLTPQLANYIGSNFTVVTQVESPGSSFDATVWKRNSDNKIFISMRGTQQLTHFLVDADLAVTGNARAQVTDMVNWLLKISTPENKSANQIALENVYSNSTPPVILGTRYVVAAPTLGTGIVSAADLANGTQVNGHSLGGYLATAFTRLFATQAHVQHTSTFNSAGFTGASESAFLELQSAIGTNNGLGRYPNGAEQSNYFAKNGLNLTTNSFWFSQQGQRVEISQESDTAQVGNHYMYKLTDALALGNALEKLDPTLTMSKLNSFLEAGIKGARLNYFFSVLSQHALALTVHVPASSLHGLRLFARSHTHLHACI